MCFAQIEWQFFNSKLKLKPTLCVVMHATDSHCPSLNIFMSESLHQVILLRTEMYTKKTILIKWYNLEIDLSA